MNPPEPENAVSGFSGPVSWCSGRQTVRADALSEISQAQARAGDVSGVLAWIADETSSYVKSFALLSAAKGLLDRIEVKKSQGTNEK